MAPVLGAADYQVATEVELIPYTLPHLLTESEFKDDRSLSEWMETWFAGFGDDEVQELYEAAEILAQARLKLEFTPALCDAEDKLTSEQRFTIWRTLIGLEA